MKRYANHAPTVIGMVLTTVALAISLFLNPGRSMAQPAAPPPPPPLEGMDPATAPPSSRDIQSPAPGDDHHTAPAPPPPTEGLDPSLAPKSSRETTSNASPSPVSPASKGAKSLSTPGSADEVEVMQNNDTSTGKSPWDVFKLDFMRRALLAGLLISGFCAFLGVYVVLRRIVFVGVALAEMSSAGVALSLLTGIAPMLGSVLTMLAGVALFSVQWGGRRIRQDAFIGIGYVVASASAVLMIAKSASGEGSLLDLLFGNILTVTASDVAVTALALGLVLVFHFAFYKEILFVAFDPDTAAASGYNSRLWDMLLYLSIGLTIAFAIHTVGVLMTFASLIIPPVTALLLTKRMGTAFAVSVIAGMIPTPLGLYLSFVADLPAAATVVVLSFGLLLIAGIISRFRT